MEFTKEQADEHNALTKEAWALLDTEIIFHDRPLRGMPGFFARRKIRRAIEQFRKALEINPDGWQSMWAIGKAFQRLGDHASSLAWFVKAHTKNPHQPNVAREAGLAALDCGAVDDAVRLCFAAVRLAPDDLGLHANLSLAYLMAGDDQRALECARVALDGAPRDEISKAVHAFVHDVVAGQKRRPAKLADAFPYSVQSQRHCL